MHYYYTKVKCHTFERILQAWAPAHTARLNTRPVRTGSVRLLCRDPRLHYRHERWSTSAVLLLSRSECLRFPPVDDLLETQTTQPLSWLCWHCRTLKGMRLIPKWVQMTWGGGVPLTLQSNRALRPSITSRMSSWRVKRGSTDALTLSLALEVSSSIWEWGGNRSEISKWIGSHERILYFGLLTFSCAQFAGVRSAIVLMYRVQQQSASFSIKVHFAIQKRRLDELSIRQPINISVLRPDHMTLEQGSLTCFHHHVPHWTNNSQAWLDWTSWKNSTDKPKVKTGNITYEQTGVFGSV